MFRIHRVWTILHPQSARHPVMSVLVGLFALCAMLVVLAIGAIAGMLMFGVSAVLALLRPRVATAPLFQRDQPARDDGSHIIDGEFSVLRKPLPHIPPR